MIFASTVSNRVVIIEIKIGRNKLDAACEQVHKYAKEARDWFETPKEVLLLGINYNTYRSKPTKVDLMEDRIEYKYSLHIYENKDKDQNEFKIDNQLAKGKGIVTYKEALQNLQGYVN